MGMEGKGGKEIGAKFKGKAIKKKEGPWGGEANIEV